jgi:hypothetical protein
MSQQPNKENKELTPMQELLIHFEDKFGYRSGQDFNFWIDKEKNAFRKAYDEGIEDGGFFGNGKDYVDRTFIK